MDLKFSIEADYEKASKAFKDLANESETTREKIEKFSNSFQTKNIDNFNEKQRLLIASLTGTRGEVAAMTTAQKNYQHEIERLIKSGLDPESDAIQKLRNEHDNLAKKIKETNEVHKKQEELIKGAEKAALGMVAAIGASVAAMGAAAQKTAEAGDQFAKTSRIIGMTAETFQELDYAAKMSGVDNLKGSLERLNKSVADVKSKTGTLTAYLKNNDKQLLDQLKNVNSNEEAFNLLMDAIGKAPDEFSRAELAQAAFGKSGQQLILMANEGADGIANLREEARKYGVISNETAANSEAFLDAQSRLKFALTGVSTELTSGLLPGLTESITKIADFIAGIDNWEQILKVTGISLVSAASALAAFVAVSKGAETVHKMGTAIKALQAAFMGPAGATALAVGALVAAIGIFATAANNAAHAGERWAETMKSTSGEAETLLTDWKNLNGEKALDEQTSTKLLALYPGLAEKMDVNTASAKDLLAAVKELNRENAAKAAQEWIEKLQKQQIELEKSEESLNNFTEASKKNMERLRNIGDIVGAKDLEDITNSRAASVDKMREKIENSVTQINAILSTVGQKLGENNTITDIPIEIKPPDEDKIDKINKTVDNVIKNLSQKLSEIDLTPEQNFNEQINQVKAYLNQRVELENKSGEERIAAFIAERDRTLSILTETAEERKAINEATDQAIADYRKKLEDEEKKRQEEELKEKNKTVAERLNEIVFNEQQKQNQQIEQFQQYLQQRMELEFANMEETGEQRITWIEEQQALLMELFIEDGDKKVALEKSVNDMILKEDDRLKKEQQKILNSKLSATSSFFGSVSELAELGAKKNVGLLVLAKMAASAEALINSYLAFTQILSNPLEGPSWVRMAAAGTVLAAGLAQQIKIVSTAIPSAETGGRFIVPNSVGSDTGLMRVNQGEEINITPRGMTGNGNTQNIIVQIEKQTIFDVVNDGIDSGDILIMAANY
jgi:hypothetical protein